MLVCLLVLPATMSAQCAPKTYNFNNMSVISGSGGVGSVYKFTSVLSGVDAFITVVKRNNATISNSNMDITGSYPQAWQPYIDFTNATNSSNDSSYIEFLVEFKKSNVLNKQMCMAMTVIDCDGSGNGNYKEMIKVSKPCTAVGVSGSTITTSSSTNWLSLVSGQTQYTNIDTSNYGAMAQVNFNDTSSFNIRVGVVGKVSRGQQRQYCFYFRGFTALLIPLSIKTETYTNKPKQSNDIELDFNSYPNPFTENINISFNNVEDAEFAVVSIIGSDGKILMTGQHTLNSHYNSISLNTESLPSGIYYLSTNVNGSTTVRVISK